MPDFVYLNDRIVPAEEAKISVFDHGFLYGDGLFETMRAYKDTVFWLDDHVDRLLASCGMMRIKLPWTKEELKKAVLATVAANNLEHAAVRLTVSRGEGPPVPDPAVCQQPTLVITCRTAAKPGGETYEKGVDVVVLKTRRNYDQAFPVSIKSCNFLNNIFAKQELKGTGAYEGLMLNYAGYLTEGTVNNLFFVRRGTLNTPELACGLLAGITRAHVIKLARQEGMEINEGKFKPEDLHEADEVFLTNSLSLIMPVRKVNDRVLSCVPGKVTAKLSELLFGIFD